MTFKRINLSADAKTLRAASAVIGREHIASLINTLALAYVGSSFPLLLLFATDADFPWWVTLNGEFLAEEIVRTIVGSTALLLAVPISTYLAIRLLSREDGGRHVHGHAH